MTARWRRLRPRDVALFVAIVAVVAVVVVMIGRELGIGGQATATLEQVSVDSGVAEATAAADVRDATPEANPDANETDGGTFRDPAESAESQDAASALSLTLSAPDICETDHGFQGWRIGETPVTWEVTGGKGPYTLDIDGETRDASGAYVGQTGTASVSCALQTGDVHYQNERDEPYRYLEGEYVVDSGLKAIRAEVTDAKGDTAIATLDVYVILWNGRHEHVMRGGHTYRVFGTLLTIPSGINMRIGDTETADTGHSAFQIYVENSDADVWLDLDGFAELSRQVPKILAATNGVDSSTDLNRLFDELIDSVGNLPTLNFQTE